MKSESDAVPSNNDGITSSASGEPRVATAGGMVIFEVNFVITK